MTRFTQASMCLSLLLLVVGCQHDLEPNQNDGSPDPYDIRIVSDEEEIRTLSSGEEIRVFSIYTQKGSGGERTLVIIYGTEIDLRDFEGTCREADHLWPEFQEDVEKSELSRVSLCQTTMNEKGERTGGLTGVTYTRNEDGLWCREPCVPSEPPEGRCFPGE